VKYSLVLSIIIFLGTLCTWHNVIK